MLIDAAMLMELVRFQDNALEKVTSGLERGDWLARPGGQASHAYWLLGHLAYCRRVAGRKLGGTISEESWEKSFARGSKPGEALEPIDLLPLRQRFLDAGRVVIARLQSMTPADLQAESGRVWPQGGSTLQAMVLFMLHFHEPYHLGQIALIGRSLGRPGLA
jgi:hypothetical protein